MIQDRIKGWKTRKANGNGTPWNKGLTISDPRVAKYSKGHAEKIRGRHPSEETRKKISLNNARGFLGKHHTKETIEKTKAPTGEKHPNWKGGISKLSWLEQKEIKAGKKRPEQCELCGAMDCKICFDHNHTTGKFRGWICVRCNFALGLVKDNIELLEAMKKYIQNGN